MQNEDIFLDTCIFMSYAHGFEKFSKACKSIITEDGLKKYASQTVINELDAAKKRREKAYTKIVFMFDGNRCTDDEIETLSKETYLTPNDVAHLQEVVEHIRCSPNSGDIKLRFNTWRILANRKLEEARKRLIRVTPKNTDAQVKYIIQSNISNKYDSEIVMDAFEFSTTMDHLLFLTSDYTDIYKNKSFIIEKLIDYRNLDTRSFDISNVVDFTKANKK